MGDRKKDVRSRKASRVSPETKLENSLPKIEPLPGAICRQMIRCGRSNCKCAKGQLHGPYYYRFFYIGGRQYKKYVKKGELSATFAACLAYKRDRQQTRELIREINATGNRMLKTLGIIIKSWS